MTWWPGLCRIIGIGSLCAAAALAGAASAYSIGVRDGLVAAERWSLIPDFPAR